MYFNNNNNISERMLIETTYLSLEE